MKLALALVPTTAAALAAGRTVMEPDVTVFEAPNWVRGERVAASALIELEFWLKHDAADLAAFHDDLLYAHAHVDYAHVEVIRVGEAYSLPAAVAAHVSLVSELVRFPRLRRSDLVAAAVDAAPNATGAWAKCGAKNSAYTNPYVLAERYGFEFPLTDAADGNSMAVAEFQGQYWDPKDLGAFSTACGLPSAISVSKTVGGNVPLLCEGLGQGCVESLLDIEYAGRRLGPRGPGPQVPPRLPRRVSPYVTAVGGTDFATKSVIGDETTWNDGGSGFSNEFAQPAWQADDVAAYLKTASGLPKARMYNATGRAYPDVAALAGLVNNNRLKAGKKSMGWLNPSSTRRARPRSDVTTGKTSGGFTGGFPAAPGWDAATGFGTVDFKKLNAAALAA
ncbi:C2 domain-containing protein [Aureococcus anophagefferens]|nr:C2 domain-containing protein [Aureococcus anophagefferens]